MLKALIAWLKEPMHDWHPTGKNRWMCVAETIGSKTGIRYGQFEYQYEMQDWNDPEVTTWTANHATRKLRRLHDTETVGSIRELLL